jgi:hypothetical protein
LKYENTFPRAVELETGICSSEHEHELECAFGRITDVTNLPLIQKEEEYATESDSILVHAPQNDEGTASSDGERDAGSEGAVAAGEDEVGDDGVEEATGTIE